MTWFDIHGAQKYLAQGGGTPPSHKLIYQMVKNGLKVSRSGDGKGNRLFFCPEWIDAYLVSKSETPRAGETRGASKQHGDGDEHFTSTAH